MVGIEITEQKKGGLRYHTIKGNFLVYEILIYLFCQLRLFVFSSFHNLVNTEEINV